MSDFEAFVRLVRDLRQAQRDYFAARRAGLAGGPEFDRAREFERQVDQAIATLTDPQRRLF